MFQSAKAPASPMLDSEYGQLTEVVLCSPDHYDWSPANAIVIEAMAKGMKPDASEAIRQFETMAAMLANAGVQCHFLTPDAHLHYQTFTRDSAIMTPWGLLISNMARAERRAEWSAVLELATTQQWPIWKTVTAGPLEGGDVQILRPGLVVIGVNDVRTSAAAANQAAGWFHESGWSVRLIRVAPHFLHLDVLFCAASENLAICAADCLEPADVAWFESQGFELLRVGYRDAMHMGCNVLSLGNGRVLSSAQSPQLNEQLQSRGIEVLAPDISQFVTEGGSAHCLTMPIRRVPMSG
jgi:arginine deiminase